MASCSFHNNEEAIGPCDRCKRQICVLDTKHYTRHVEAGISMLGGQTIRGAQTDFDVCPICYVEFLELDNVGLTFYLFAIPIGFVILVIWALQSQNILFIYIAFFPLGMVFLNKFLIYRHIKRSVIRRNSFTSLSQVGQKYLRIDR